MTRLILHVGLQKTGSTALQQALAAGAGQDFAYPLPPAGQGQWRRDIRDALLEGDDGPLRSALAEIEVSGAPAGVISYEELYELPDAALDQMAALVGHGEVVIFLRRQEELADSFINQLWKAHRVSHDEAMARADRYETNPAAFDYAAILDRLSLRFARATPLIYAKGRSSVAAFAEAAGLPLAEPTGGPPDANPAASAVEVATLREVKRRAGAHPRLPEIVEATRQALSRPGLRRWLSDRRDGPGTMLDPAARARVAQLYAASNARLAARWFPGREDLFPPPARTAAPLPVGPREGVVRAISRQFQLSGG